jgi:predicted  nucleic acid-binding Zn-ribbon protein
MIFKCRDCGQLLEADRGMAGLMVECPKCGSVIHVPDTNDAAVPAAADQTAAHVPDAAEEQRRKSETIRIELPPNLGIPEAPRRRITIRRKH